MQAGRKRRATWEALRRSLAGAKEGARQGPRQVRTKKTQFAHWGSSGAVSRQARLGRHEGLGDAELVQDSGDEAVDQIVDVSETVV